MPTISVSSALLTLPKFPQVFHPPQPPPALTLHLHLTRYASLYERKGIYIYFSVKNQGINWLRHQYIGPFSEHTH